MLGGSNDSLTYIATTIDTYPIQIGDNKGMEIPWFPITTAAVALIGVFAGSLLTRTNEHRQWLRNEKLSAYSAYLEKFGTIQLSTYFEMLDESENIRDSLAFIDSIHRVCLRVIIIAPEEILVPVQESMDEVTRISTWSSNLSHELGAEYYRESMTSIEREEAGELVSAEAYRQINKEMTEYSMGGYRRLEKVANLMRDDLKVSDYVPTNIFQRLTFAAQALAGTNKQAPIERTSNK